MKRIALMLMVVTLVAASAQAKYVPDPIVRYKIKASLDPQSKVIEGNEVILWKNETKDTIPDLQFHLYLNAFKNTYSTMAREGLRSRLGDIGKFEDMWGYQQVHAIKVDGQDLTSRMEFIHPDDDYATDQTVMRVLLPKAIAPGQTVNIEIDWTSRLPKNIIRTGYLDNYFLVAQWFPKPGVYEPAGMRGRAQGGWNTHQFHAWTEFYADYGVFDVDLTVPSNFELAAAGEERSAKHNPDGTTTYNYYQEDIHDFVWVTQPKSQARKIVRWFRASEQTTPAEIEEWARKTGASPEEVKLQDVKVTLFTYREHGDQVERHFKAVFAGLKWFGLMYGKYPYDVLTFVDPPKEAGGGMEYPTFFTAGTEYWPGALRLSPEGVVVHEFGHQFWYGMVGNNEPEDAWLDEGFNSYSTGKVLEKAYGPNYHYYFLAGIPVPGREWVSITIPWYPWNGAASVALGPYWEYVAAYQRYGNVLGYMAGAQSDSALHASYKVLDRSSHRTQAYTKPELTLRTLEQLLGDAWPKVIRTYQQRFRFKHPGPQDFINTVNEVSGRNMQWFFDQTLNGTGLLNYSVSFKSDRAPARLGYFDEKGQPKLVRPGEDMKERPFESEVLVRRLGEMQFPVIVRVKFKDGSEVRERWDGQYRWTKFSYTAKPQVVSAEVDPDQAFALEVPRVDNSFQAQPVTLAAEKWYLRWVVWIQNVLLAFSFFA